MFHEEQQFRQLWVRALIIFVSLTAWYGFVQQIILGQPFGNQPAPDNLLIVITILFGIGFPIFFYSMKLTTDVDQDGIHIRFFPFLRKKIPFSQITHFKAHTYRPLVEYGGWGIRYGGTKKGWAYNISGNEGVQLELSDGKKILIGSRIAPELEEAIRQGVSIKTTT